jgi:hypothetical protein
VVGVPDCWFRQWSDSPGKENRPLVLKEPVEFLRGR